MSRTFRRKNVTQEYYWILRDWDWAYNTYSICYGCRKIIDPKSQQAKNLLAKYHSDSGTHACKEPGPAWYRNVTRQRPLRREGKEQLRKFMLNEEHEVMITENPPLEYWT
jgi:hypothetical protein